jgi:hypothetical protein
MKMLTGVRSQIVSILGIVFVIASRYVPKELLTEDVKNMITEILLAAYGLFMALKVARQK